MMIRSLGRFRHGLPVLACALTLTLSAAAHGAVPKKVLVVASSDNAADALPAQIRRNTSAAVTVGGGDLSKANLAGFDAVVIGRDFAWIDQNATGDALADFEDSGGVVIASAASFRSAMTEPGQAVLGRWSTGGYAPFLPDLVGPASAAQAPFVDDVLGQNPILQGLGQLTNAAADSPHLAPGAISLLNWSDGRVAVAIKGRAVAINGLLGDSYLGEGDVYGRLIAHSILALSGHSQEVQIRGRGVVTSDPSGLECSSSCKGGLFFVASQVRLHGQPRKGSAFLGWSRGCTGTADCVVTTGYPGTDPTKWYTPPVRATFVDATVTGFRVDSRGVTAVLPRTGRLVVTGLGVKKLTKTVKASGRARLRLKRTGTRRKIKLTFTFTPKGAAKGVATKKTLTLK